MLMHIARIILKCNACLNIAVMHTAAIALQCNIFLRIAQMQISVVHCKAQGGPVLNTASLGRWKETVRSSKYSSVEDNNNKLLLRMLSSQIQGEPFCQQSNHLNWFDKTSCEAANQPARGSLSLHWTRTNVE